jgi:hypothetical protein
MLSSISRALYILLSLILTTNYELNIILVHLADGAEAQREC